MDDPALEGPEIVAALRELRIINRFLGGASTSVSALAPLLASSRQPVRLLDVGCGGADVPVAIVEWCRRRRIAVHVTVVDLGRDACRHARAYTGAYPEIEVCRADVFHLPFREPAFDVAHCSLFLHHFTQAEIARILRMLAGQVRQGIVINDLHRHPLAYFAIWVLTRCLSHSRLVRYDAPLSVRRAFRREDLRDIGTRCDFAAFEWRWRWAFRYVGVARPGAAVAEAPGR